MNIIIAVILFLLTSLLGYISWYILRGRSKKEKAMHKAAEKDRQKKKSQGSEESQPSAIGRESYCYPEINDVMGYDFISVVNVPDELLGIAKKVEDKPDWGSSQSSGLTAVSSTVEEDPDTPRIQPDERPAVRKAQSRRAGQENQPKEPEYEEDVVVVDVPLEVSPDELDQINRLDGDWTNRDYDDAIDDETLNAIIDANADMIEQSEPSEEDLRAAMERQAMQSILEMEQRLIETENQGNLAGDIMSELGEDTDDDWDMGENEEGNED